jgi:hypothetical protein
MRTTTLRSWGIVSLTLALAGLLVGVPALPACAGPNGQNAQAAPSTRPGRPRLPEAVLRDPAQRLARLEHLRRQMVRDSKDISEQRWQAVVRADLRRQLEALGFDRAEVDRVLDDVDAARK